MREELLVLNQLWQERQRSTTEVARLIQKPGAEARALLQKLVEARGERKGRTWHLSAATYRRLGEPAAYIRQRGFEPIQQEQMMLQYVEMHGHITRREAAELCKISPPATPCSTRQAGSKGNLRRALFMSADYKIATRRYKITTRGYVRLIGRSEL